MTITIIVVAVGILYAWFAKTLLRYLNARTALRELEEADRRARAPARQLIRTVNHYEPGQWR